MIEVGKEYKLKGKDFILNSPSILKESKKQQVSKYAGLYVKVIDYRYTASYNQKFFIIELPDTFGDASYIESDWLIP